MTSVQGPSLDARSRLRSRLRFIASQAKQAQALNPDSDNLLDLIDSIDNDVQAVIDIINRLRRADEGDTAGSEGQRRTVTVTFTTNTHTDVQVSSTQGIRAEVRSWLESLKADVGEIHVTATTEGAE